LVIFPKKFNFAAASRSFERGSANRDEHHGGKGKMRVKTKKSSPPPPRFLDSELAIAERKAYVYVTKTEVSSFIIHHS